MIVLNTDMMLWHLRVNDQLAKELEIEGDTAFLRGFILKNRETGKVWATYRFKYPNGHTNWYEIRLDMDQISKGVDPATYLKSGLELTFATAGEMQGVQIEMQWFKVPEGDAVTQVLWLKEHDLIEVSERKMEIA